GTRIHCVIFEKLHPHLGFVFLAHRDPSIGNYDVCPVQGLLIVGGDQDGAACFSGALLSSFNHVLSRQVTRRTGDSNVHASGGAAQQVGVGHVIRCVSEVGQRLAFRSSLGFPHSL